MTHSQANRLMILAAILWGMGNVALQTVLQHIGPFTAVMLRCLIATLIFLPTLGSKARLASLAHKSTRWLALAAALSFAIAVTLSQAGYGQTSVTNAGFLTNTTTVITPILAWFVLRQRPHILVWLAAVLILIGATLMSGGSLQGPRLGDALCLGSAVFYAWWMICLGEYANKSGDAASLTLVQFAFTSLICLPLSLGIEHPTAKAIMAALPELLFLGFFSTAAAYFLQAIAQKFTSASEAAVIGSGEAVIGALAAFLLLGELMTGLSAIGAGLVSAGILVVQLPAFTQDLLQRKALATIRLKEPSRHQLNPDVHAHERTLASARRR